MLRHAAVLILGLGALTLAPGAPGLPDVPGDPTPPVVTMSITGTLGSAGWYTSNVTVNWTVTALLNQPFASGTRAVALACGDVSSYLSVSEAGAVFPARSRHVPLSGVPGLSGPS